MILFAKQVLTSESDIQKNETVLTAVSFFTQLQVQYFFEKKPILSIWPEPASRLSLVISSNAVSVQVRLRQRSFLKRQLWSMQSMISALIIITHVVTVTLLLMHEACVCNVAAKP